MQRRFNQRRDLWYNKAREKSPDDYFAPYYNLADMFMAIEMSYTIQH
jgi:hypothetical protein